MGLSVEDKGEIQKTITLGHEDDDPSVSIMRGHVDGATFTKGQEAEGWEGDPVETDRLAYEYWRNEGDSWTRSLKDDPKAEPVTALYW